jgi:hypothetical protein
MRSFCIDGAELSGASYKAIQSGRALCKTIFWFTPTNLNDLATDTTIVNTSHASLLVPGPGHSTCLITEENLVNACSPSTQCLFVNCFRESETYHKTPGYNHTAVPRAISVTQGKLQCVSLVETNVTSLIVEELLNCKEMKGLMLSNCFNDKTHPVTDELFASLLRASGSQLEWLYFDVNGSNFGEKCFEALADGCCPKLKLLYVERPVYTLVRASPSTIRRAVGPSSELAKTLKVLLVFPGNDGKSSIVLGANNDKLGI